MMQDEPETRATFEIVLDEVRMHIASYLDTQSLCFFAATSRRSLGNTLAELKQRLRPMLAQMLLQVKVNKTFCYTSHALYACGDNQDSQLGLGHNNACSQLTRAEHVPGSILQVVAGDFHTLVLTDEGLYGLSGVIASATKQSSIKIPGMPRRYASRNDKKNAENLFAMTIF